MRASVRPSAQRLAHLSRYHGPKCQRLYATRDDSNSDKPTHFGYRTIPEQLKESLVGQVFSNVASSYDRMNDVMSLGIHRLWKDEFVKGLAPGARGNFAPMKILDVAGGTGDIAFRHLDYATDVQFDHETSVEVVDINPEMLEVGKQRASQTRYKDGRRIAFTVGNAETLTHVADASVDLYTIAFGIRNVTHIDRVLAEAFRVLKPGGVFSCLEFSHVKPAPLASLYNRYSFSVIPIMGQLVAGDRDSYQYLVESIRKFPDQETFAKMIQDAGFLLSGPGYKDLSFGIAAIHTGVKPKSAVAVAASASASAKAKSAETDRTGAQGANEDLGEKLRKEDADPAVIAS